MPQAKKPAKRTQKAAAPKVATRISVHLRLANLGEEIVLDHVEGGFVQVYDIDYRGGSGIGQDYLVSFAVVEPITQAEADQHRENYVPGKRAERYTDAAYPTPDEVAARRDAAAARTGAVKARAAEAGVLIAAQEFGMSPSAVERIVDGLAAHVPVEVRGPA